MKKIFPILLWLLNWASAQGVNNKAAYIDVKQAEDFRFELHHAPPVPCPECKGCTCKAIFVFDRHEKAIFQQVVVGNSLTFSYDNIDSLQIGDYNFDGHTDFRVFNGKIRQQQYYVYEPARHTFLREPLLGQLTDAFFDFENKKVIGTTSSLSIFQGDSLLHLKGDYLYALTCTGKKLENVSVEASLFVNPWNGPNPALDTISIEKGHKKDTMDCVYIDCYLMLREKNPHKVKIQKDSFLFILQAPLPYKLLQNAEINRCRMLFAAKLASVDSNLIFREKGTREDRHLLVCTDSLRIEDMDGDGIPEISYYERGSSRFHYFVFNSQTNSFEQDSLLSKLEYAYYNEKEKRLEGYQVLKLDSLTRQTNYYEYRQGKAILIRQSICTHTFPYSEKLDCIYYELENGEMIYKTTILGCE